MIFSTLGVFKSNILSMYIQFQVNILSSSQIRSEIFSDQKISSFTKFYAKRINFTHKDEIQMIV